jgi:aminoglycoside 6'-N-acetyltransferase
MPRVRGEDATEVFVVVLGDRPVGLIQRYRLVDYPEWDAAIGLTDAAAGIDYYLGEPATVGQGIGTKAISSFARDTLTHYPDVRCVVAAPQQANAASWRALEKAGFVRVWAGILNSDDPSDEGPAYVYVFRDPVP